MPNFIFIPLIFISATAWMYFLSTCAPNAVKVKGSQIGLNFPYSLEEVKLLANTLQAYYKANKTYVLLIFVSAYLYKQAFAIPGSVFLNLLAGSLFGIRSGFILTSILTAIGATCCYSLSRYFGKPYILKYFPDRVHSMQNKIMESKDDLFYFLLFSRLMPTMPNWLLNIAAPILNIPIHYFFLSVLIGLMPYNFICVQTGIVLSTIRSLDDLFTYGTLARLVVIALLSLIPTVIRRLRLQDDTKSK